MRVAGVLLAIALGAVIGPALAGEVGPAPPRTGEITAHDVNVRAGAHVNYEIVAQLDKGDLVLITGERGDWVRIAMPPGVLVWVSTKHVASDGLVESNRVNVRSGPALKYNVLCQLARDATVTITQHGEDGEWYGIEPPEAAGVYIYGEYVAAKGGAELYAQWAPRKATCTALLARGGHVPHHRTRAARGAGPLRRNR